MRSASDAVKRASRSRDIADCSTTTLLAWRLPHKLANQERTGTNEWDWPSTRATNLDPDLSQRGSPKHSGLAPAPRGEATSPPKGADQPRPHQQHEARNNATTVPIGYLSRLHNQQARQEHQMAALRGQKASLPDKPKNNNLNTPARSEGEEQGSLQHLQQGQPRPQARPLQSFCSDLTCISGQRAMQQLQYHASNKVSSARRRRRGLLTHRA